MGVHACLLAGMVAGTRARRRGRDGFLIRRGRVKLKSRGLFPALLSLCKVLGARCALSHHSLSLQTTHRGPRRPRALRRHTHKVSGRCLAAHGRNSAGYFFGAVSYRHVSKGPPSDVECRGAPRLFGGEAWAKVPFPDCWKTQLLSGTVTGNEKNAPSLSLSLARSLSLCCCRLTWAWSSGMIGPSFHRRGGCLCFVDRHEQ